jgi:hypothetical protein
VTVGDYLPRTFAFVDIDAHVDPAELARIAPGLQAQLRDDFAPAWGVGALDTILPTPMTSEQAVAAGYCQIQLHAEAPADEQGALAIHGVDANGNPIVHAYVRLLERCNTSLSSALSHELCEQGADPKCDRVATLPDGRVAAVEVCDQVEALTYTKNGVEVSDFNLPSNFGIGGTSAPYDFMGKQENAFEVMPGGYAQVRGPDGWSQLQSDSMRKSAYRAELDRLGLSRPAVRARAV